MDEKRIDSIGSLLEHLDSDNSKYNGSVWYRGHSVHTWKLDPGYYRLKNPPSEGTLLKKFKQSAAMLIDQQPSNTFDWLFLMQHYGVPTRLLDWSESPLVGLYFAVSESKYLDEDATLWSLRPTELNKDANIYGDEEFFIPSFEDVELVNYSVETLAQNPRQQSLPIATIATRNNARIQAQLGVFTIHHLDKSPIEEIGDKDHVHKYTIPKESKATILQELKLLGIDKFQMFPELSSIGDTIKETIS